jgi:hypothetical protein
MPSSSDGGLALVAVYGGVRMAMHQATRTIQLRLGPFVRAERVGADAVQQCRFPFLMSLSHL